MKITDVKATTLKGYKDWNYVKVETDEGISGVGEAHPGEGISDAVTKRLRPMLIGQNPLNVEPLYTRMIDRSTGQSSAGLLLGAIGGGGDRALGCCGQSHWRAGLSVVRREISRPVANVRGCGPGAKPHEHPRNMGPHAPKRAWQMGFRRSNLTLTDRPMNGNTTPWTGGCRWPNWTRWKRWSPRCARPSATRSICALIATENTMSAMWCCSHSDWRSSI